MSIEQGVFDGFIHIGITPNGLCCIRLANEEGIQSNKRILLQSKDCYAVASSLIDYAQKIEVIETKKGIGGCTEIRYREIIHYLMDLLAEIDTHGDRVIMDDKRYRELVEVTQKKRWKTGIAIEDDEYVLDNACHPANRGE